MRQKRSAHETYRSRGLVPLELYQNTSRVQVYFCEKKLMSVRPADAGLRYVSAKFGCGDSRRCLEKQAVEHAGENDDDRYVTHVLFPLSSLTSWLP